MKDPRVDRRDGDYRDAVELINSAERPLILAGHGIMQSGAERDVLMNTRRRWPAVDYDIGIGPQTPFMEPDEWLRSQHQTGAGRNWRNQ